jgi:DNA-binding transcriptional ArsR family regulator
MYGEGAGAGSRRMSAAAVGSCRRPRRTEGADGFLDRAAAAAYFTARLINHQVKLMSTDPLSTVFAALADPTRRAILARLASGEASVTELAEPFDMSLPAVSKHLKVLERAGLIERGREAQWRPCRLRAEPLREVDGWVEQYRRHWEESFDRLDEYLRRLQNKERSDDSGDE